MIIASRVLKTRDSIETRVFKTRFTRFADSLTWKIFATWRFQTPLLYRLSQCFKHSLSLSSTLSVSQALSISQALSLSLWNTLALKHSWSPSNVHRPRHQMLRPHSDDPLTHPLKSLKRSPSNARRQTLAVKRSPSSACNKITATVKRYPLCSDYIPTIPFP